MNDFWDPESKKHLIVLTTLEGTRVFSLSIAVGKAVPPPPLEAKSRHSRSND